MIVLSHGLEQTNWLGLVLTLTSISNDSGWCDIGFCVLDLVGDGCGLVLVPMVTLACRHY